MTIGPGLATKLQIMFCPKCGKADQSPETFCRQCGIFLPDLSKPVKTAQTPQQHLTANLVLNSMTIVACFTLAILIYSMLAFRPDTHPLIYVTAGLLIAMGCWHVQTLWRTIILRRHFKNEGRRPIPQPEIDGRSVTTGKLLDHPDFENMVPASVTDKTTRHLSKSKNKGSA